MNKKMLSMALAGCVALPLFAAKTMVIFSSAGDSPVSLAVADSAKLPGSGSLNLYQGGSGSPAGFSAVDSIRFYDAAAVLSPVQLYNGATAHPMLLGTGNAFVTLDLRNYTSNFSGEITTDILDLLDTANGGVASLATLSNVTIITQANLPSGSAIAVSYKTGDTYFTESGWSAWTGVSGLRNELTGLSKRYLKLRLVLTTNAKAALPTISRVALYANYANVPAFSKAVNISAFQNERIVTSPYPFAWETRDNTKVKSFTTGNNLASIFAGATEFDKIYALTDWVAKRTQDRSYPWSTYPWDISQVFLSDGRIRGHCMSYAEVLITGLSGLGYYARHWAIEDYGKIVPNNHEVVEVWSNQYKKWIYQDPSLDTYYADPVTNEPLSILEMHTIKMNNLTIKNVDGKYHYGVYTSTYNWQSLQGYSTCGYMEMTNRNNFHSQPSPSYSNFGNGVGYNTFYMRTDSKTPPYSSTVTKYTGRDRDFWFTLNQASIKAKRGAETSLTVEFGQSQPYFKQYSLSVDGGGATVQAASTYAWNLHAGANTLTVTPEDNWGTKGLPSTLSVNY